MTSTTKTVTKAAGIMMAAIFLSRISGLLRDMVIAHKFGAGAAVDAYTVAFNLPDLLWFLLSIGALSGAFIPVFSEHWTKGEKEEAWKVFNIVGTFIFILMTVIIVLCEIFTRELLPLVARGGLSHDPQMQEQVILLTRILLPAQLFFLIGGLIMGTLNTQQHFLTPALGPTIYNLGIMCGGLILGDRFGIQGLAWGALIGAFIGNFLLQVIVVRRFGVVFKPSLNLRHPSVIKIGKLVLPVILGVSLPYVDTWFNRYFAANLGESAEAALNYSNRLMQLPLGVFAQAAAVALFPTMAALAARKAMEELKQSVNFGLRGLLMLTVPSSVLMIVLAKPMIVTLYQSGKFTSADADLVAPALILYSVGIVGWAGQGIITRAFYSLQSGFIPAISGTFVTLFIFIPLCIYLVQTPLTYSGLALATSIAVVTHMLILLEVLRRKLGGLHGRLILSSFLKVLLASFTAGGVAWIIIQHMSIDTRLHALIGVLAASIPAVAVYVGMIFLLKLDEAREIWKPIAAKLRRRSSRSAA
ncbi:MAG: murein biosynthesis integral membrane protein MurJ [Armatimonadota bacterium]